MNFMVSILVLLDDAYRLEELKQEEKFLAGFQSLFFWMMPTGIALGGVITQILEVSILVLLDDAYRRSFRADY